MNKLNAEKIREQTIKEAASLESGHKDIKAIGISGSARDESDMALEDSNSEFLLNCTLDELKKLGAKTELLQLRKYDIKPCKACYSTTNAHCHFPCSCYPKGTPKGDDMSNVLYEKVLDADIIIFATPVNNFKVSSLMALFLDRCISLDGSLSPVNPDAPKDKALNIEHSKFISAHADQSVYGSGFLRRFAGKVGGIIVTGHEAGAAMTISQMFMTLSHFGMAFPPFSNMYAMASIENGTYNDKAVVTGSVYIKDAKLLAANVMTMTKSLKKIKPSQWAYDYSVN